MTGLLNPKSSKIGNSFSKILVASLYHGSFYPVAVLFFSEIRFWVKKDKSLTLKARKLKKK